MNIAFQLFRENRALEILYRKACLYTQPQVIKSSWASKFNLRQDLNFTFEDNSVLRIVRGSCGQFIHASLTV